MSDLVTAAMRWVFRTVGLRNTGPGSVRASEAVINRTGCDLGFM
jgi:hypothetical protein